MLEVTLPVFITIWVTVAVIVFVTLVVIVKAVKRKGSLLDLDYIEEKKNNIKHLLNGNSSTEYAMAIIEADKLLDYFLKARRFQGDTLGERLKMACYTNSSLKKVWKAHLLRNRIVHDHDIEITAKQARECWKDYNRAYNILTK